MTTPANPRGVYGALKPSQADDDQATEAAPAPKAKRSKATPLAQRIKAQRAPKPQRTTKEYGRAALGHPQLNVRIPPDTKRRLARYCVEHEVEMAEVITMLIDEHVPA